MHWDSNRVGVAQQVCRVWQHLSHKYCSSANYTGKPVREIRLGIMSQTESPPQWPSKLPTILVTGAYSGLGRALWEHLVTAGDDGSWSPLSLVPEYRVVAIDKQPYEPDSDKDDPYGRSVYVQADVTSPRHELEAQLQKWIGPETPVHLVIHSAGIRGLVPGVPIRSSADVAGAESLGVMDVATMMRTFEVNTVGTLNVLTAVLPNLRLAAAAGLRPRVAVMSSRIGSMTANARGGAYAYRASKAALNAVVRSMSVDVPEVCFAMVHPGRVESGLVCVKEDGAMSCDESLRTLLPVLERLGEGHLKSGCFVDRFGVEIPW